MTRNKRGIEERHGFPGALRALGGVGGRIAPPHVIMALLLLLECVPAAAHEERLLVGRVETIDMARRRLVVVGAEGSERRRLEVTPETEALACRAVSGLATVSAGALVRVKYVEKAGSPSRAESILVLGGGR